jgi:hypothetical protein
MNASSGKSGIMVDIALALETKDLAKASDCIKAAAQLCPESVEVKEVMATVEELKRSVCRDIRKARSLLRVAEFSEARDRLACAREKWRSHSVIVKITRAIEKTEKTYAEAIALAHAHLRRNEFKKASAACSRALKTCPSSPSAKTLSQKIQHIWRANAKLQDKLVGITLLTIIIGVPLTMALFLVPGDLSFSIGRHVISEVLLKTVSVIVTVLAFVVIVAADSLVRQ